MTDKSAKEIRHASDASLAPYENGVKEKPEVHSDRGIVASQNAEAAAVGAKVLNAGGNAIDAGIATAFALTVAEPWMSGLGGGGYMVVKSAREDKVRVIDFGMCAPRGLDPADYPPAEGVSDDLFEWPAVEGDKNAQGYHSIAVPGSVAGYTLAQERFGNLAFADVVNPAVELAERGHRVTWWTTLNVAADAANLSRYENTSPVYLPGGFPPNVDATPFPTFLDMGNLKHTLSRLAEAGGRDFYEGDLAETLVSELQAGGSKITLEELSAYQAVEQDALEVKRGEAVLHVPPGLTAGPTFFDSFAEMPQFAGLAPDADTYASYASAMRAAYDKRLATMGHAGDHGDRSCTTHIAAADIDGNMVSITTTLLARFGSRVVLPETGILMNNGIYWFDPRPGSPNSLTPGVKPLCNMVPTLATRDGAPWFAVGASGGRKIMPAVLQLSSFLADFGMSMTDAFQTPRIDISEPTHILGDERLSPAAQEALAGVAPMITVEPVGFPGRFAFPCGVMLDNGKAIGTANAFDPLGAAIPA